MTNKIYEYKDGQDWYVGSYGIFGGVRTLTDDDLDFPLLEFAQRFRDEDRGFPVSVTVLRYGSLYRLLSFVVDILNQEMGRNVEVIQRQGALLVVENGQLLYVELPKEGVDVHDFFETSKVRETLLIATRNEGKTKEFRAIFDKLGYDVENLNDYPDLPEVAETGMTFEENARLKAETISQLTGKMVLADDSGLKVDVLGGLPGVWSARFAGVGATDRENNAKLLHVELPKEGVDVEAFFETNKVRETLLIATRNEGKTKEFRAIFDKLGYDVENLNDYPDLPEVAETGMTFEENARLKAETISQLTGKMVLADDSGLKVDVLGGLPGVWSARFAGVGATDRENNAKLLHELAMVFELKDRSAQFHTTLVVASPNKESLVVEADWPGYINFEPKGENGFGYDPLFLVGETGKSSAELTLEEKNSQSHRALAVKKLLEVFPSWQSKPSL